MAERRKDSKKRVLKEGEYQRSNGTYEYRWRSENGKRNNVYAKSLEELREKEAEIQRDRSDGIRSEARNATINDIHEQWLQLKKGLKKPIHWSITSICTRCTYSRSLESGRSEA